MPKLLKYTGKRTDIKKWKIVPDQSSSSLPEVDELEAEGYDTILPQGTSAQDIVNRLLDPEGVENFDDVQFNENTPKPNPNSLTPPVDQYRSIFKECRLAQASASPGAPPPSALISALARRCEGDPDLLHEGASASGRDTIDFKEDRDRILLLLKQRWGESEDKLELINKIYKIMLEKRQPAKFTDLQSELVELEKKNSSSTIGFWFSKKVGGYGGVKPTKFDFKTLRQEPPPPPFKPTVPDYQEGEGEARAELPYELDNDFVCVQVTWSPYVIGNGHAFLEIIGPNPHQYLCRGYNLFHDRESERDLCPSLMRTFTMPPIRGSFEEIAKKLSSQDDLGIVPCTPVTMEGACRLDQQALRDRCEGKARPRDKKTHPGDPGYIDKLKRKGWDTVAMSADWLKQQIAAYKGKPEAPIPGLNKSRNHIKQEFQRLKGFFCYESDEERYDAFLRFLVQESLAIHQESHKQGREKNLELYWYEECIKEPNKNYKKCTKGEFAPEDTYDNVTRNCSDAVAAMSKCCGYNPSWHIPFASPGNVCIDLADEGRNILKRRLKEKTINVKDAGLTRTIRKLSSNWAPPPDDAETQQLARLLLIQQSFKTKLQTMHKIKYSLRTFGLPDFFLRRKIEAFDKILAAAKLGRESLEACQQFNADVKKLVIPRVGKSSRITSTGTHTTAASTVPTINGNAEVIAAIDHATEPDTLFRAVQNEVWTIAGQEINVFPEHFAGSHRAGGALHGVPAPGSDCATSSEASDKLPTLAEIMQDLLQQELATLKEIQAIDRDDEESAPRRQRLSEQAGNLYAQINEIARCVLVEDQMFADDARANIKDDMIEESIAGQPFDRQQRRTKSSQYMACAELILEQHFYHQPSLDDYIGNIENCITTLNPLISAENNDSLYDFPAVPGQVSDPDLALQPVGISSHISPSTQPDGNSEHEGPNLS